MPEYDDPYYEDEPEEDEIPPEPVAYCPRCKAPWYTLEAGFCGGCGLT
jgi:hypothetical protein